MRITLCCILLSLAALAAPLNLKRIRVGHQAGILKVYAPDLKTVTFVKGSALADADVTGIDGVKWAPLSAADREALLAALGIAPADADAVAVRLLQNYAHLPHLEAVAMLGALASGPLPPVTTQKVVRFLLARLKARETVQVRRQAVLSLALIPAVDFPEVVGVLNFMASSRNGWETFTTVQFFEYHKSAILQMANLPEIKKRLQKSGNPRAEGILAALEQP